MRLSKLSDRQLRRLVRNVEVRFGEETLDGVYKSMAKAMANLERKLYSAQEDGKKIFNLARSLPQEHWDNGSMKSFRRFWNQFNLALSNSHYKADEFESDARKYKNTPIK